MQSDPSAIRSSASLDTMPAYPDFPLPPLDRDGRRVRVGARVRIVGVPNLSGMRLPDRRTTAAVFRHISGTYRRVSGFDRYGCAEIFFAIRRGRCQGLHSVAIEPYLLLVPSSRPHPATKAPVNLAKRRARASR